ncbi:sugar ABC transporter ATP-binding protein [Nocardioides sp. GXZ039]|uniref:sugar ABC transporter ATP-binding protein n=1 Tax=Nocardioides sp. GXZ039 TaxID=3136018 RepID=UPI0030F3F7B3
MNSTNVPPPSPTGQALLEAVQISKAYGAVRALEGVSLTIRRGEIVALAGENGSGKSTLAKVIVGALSADAGEVRIDGAPVRLESPRDGLRHGVALVSQEPTLVPDMSVAENISLAKVGRTYGLVGRRQLETDVQPLLTMVGVSCSPSTVVASLSAVDRELVEIAKALATTPDLLILDEATTRMIDPERLFCVLEKLAADGLAVLFVTHKLREIRRLAERVVVLRDGRVSGELGRDELTTDSVITELMVGRELDDLFQRVPSVVGEPVLSVEELVLRESARPISFQVRAGEVVGIAGLGGAGRSSLLASIAGSWREGGEISVNGTSIPANRPHAAVQAGVSMVPEDRHAQGLVLSGSICLNVSLSSHRVLHRTRAAEERRRAADAVRNMRIKCSSIHAPVTSLSGGNQQKVVIGRALASDPMVLLLDEPTRGVDIGAKQEIYHLISEVTQASKAVVLATSDMLELLGLCDRILVLFEKELVGEISGESATEQEIVMYSTRGALDV